MANLFIHIIIIFTLLIAGCASKLSPPTSTLPAVSLSEKIHIVENYLPVKGWFRWSEKTLVDRMENYKVPGVSIANPSDRYGQIRYESWQTFTWVLQSGKIWSGIYFMRRGAKFYFLAWWAQFTWI